MSGMTIGESGGGGITERQAIGAEVVTKTLDTMNGMSGKSSSPAPVDRETAGAAVVSKTLDYLNAGKKPSGSTGADYDFQKSVLGAAYSGKGALVDVDS